MRATPLVISKALRETVVAMAARGESAERRIALMREKSLPKIQAIRLLSDATHISLAEAKRVVHFSSVWEDRKVADEAFHERAAKALVGLPPKHSVSEVEQKLKMRA